MEQLKNILVTGGAGFIGSNFINFFLNKRQNYNVINLDLLTYAGNLINLREVESSSRYKFIKGDIADRKFVEDVFKINDISGVINFAAESHVDNSISDPSQFIKTNILGTFNLLDVARLSWGSNPKRFLHISTDEVYGTLGKEGLFTETTPYAPNSPYSASKASSDLIVRSYFHTFGMNVLTTNCSNNYGPKQHNEKLIPTIIRNALAGNPIPIYGDGKNIRDWLYVEDHCVGIDLAFHNGYPGETYNIGGRNEKTNLEVVKHICTQLDMIAPRVDGNSYSSQITFVKDRLGHDKRYAIDASKIERELGWVAQENFESGIARTIEWYLENYNNKEN